MAEVAGLAIAVACLFSTCVQCFDFYRAGHNLEKNLEIVLVKLDIEKTRLLTWGNTLGILKSPQDGRSKELDDLGAAELVKLKRYLEQIEFLLTDADKLQNEYGLQMGMAAPGSGSLAPQSGSRSKIQSLQMLSSNSMNLFKTSYKRFWVQNMSEKCKPSKISRTKWAIHDQSKFERLVSDLRGLVDGLFNILPVTQAVQDKIIKEDISSILDLSKLRLVQAACTRTYSPWSDIASAIIEASEIGTIDRRNVEEWLNDVEGLENQNTDNGRNLPGKRLEKTPGSSTKDLTLNLPHINATICFMFTGSCINLTAGAQSYCNRNLGATISKDALGTAWSFVSSRWGETILRRILASLNMTSFAIDWEELTKEVYDEVVLSARKLMVPCAMVYIYCAPCVCLIQTALKFCQSNEFSPLLDVKVRPDVRLTSRCCAEEANFAGVESLLEEIKQAERDNRDSMFAGIDRMWLEQRNFEHEAELIPPYQEDVTNNAAKIFEMHRGERKCASIIILSDVEEQQVLSLMQTQPLPKTARMPREDEIFQAKWNKPKQWHWQYLGTYTNSRPTGGEGRNLEEAVAERIDVTSHTSGSGLDTKRKRSESSDDESDKDDEDAGTFAKLRR